MGTREKGISEKNMIIGFKNEFAAPKGTANYLFLHMVDEAGNSLVNKT